MTASREAPESRLASGPVALLTRLAPVLGEALLRCSGSQDFRAGPLPLGEPNPAAQNVTCITTWNRVSSSRLSSSQFL